MSTLCITGNTRISCTEFVCDKRKHNCKCLLIFVLPKTQKTKHFREGLRFVVRADLIYNYSTLFPLLRHLLDGLEMLSLQNTIRCLRLSREIKLLQRHRSLHNVRDRIIKLPHTFFLTWKFGDSKYFTLVK